MKLSWVVSRKVIYYLVLLLGLSACDQGPPLDEVQAEGDKLFTALAASNIDNALALYDDEFFKMHGREQWRQKLDQMRQKLGMLKEYHLRKDFFDTRYSGHFYIFEYQTIYDRGNAWETLTFVNPNGSREVKLVGHQVKGL